MDEEQRREYVALKEQELREQDARIARLEARARDDEAGEQLSELTGLRQVNAKLREGLARLKEQTGTELQSIHPRRSLPGATSNAGWSSRRSSFEAR